MTSPRRTVVVVACSALVALGAAGCSKPDPNAPVRITGDPAKAVPPTSSTTSTTTSTTTTTLYYAPKP